MNDFGNLLYTLRKRKGLTQQELADELGVTNKAVSKWETGEAFPETGLLLPLADLLGVTADDLLRGKYSPPTPSQTPQTAPATEGQTENEAPMSENEAQKQARSGANSGPLSGTGNAQRTRFILGIALGAFGAAVCIFALVLAATADANGALISLGTFFAVFTLGFLALGTGGDILLYALLTRRYAFRGVEDAAYPIRLKRFRGLVIGGASVIYFSIPLLFPAFAAARALVFLVLFILLLLLGVFLILYGAISWHKFSAPLLSKKK